MDVAVGTLFGTVNLVTILIFAGAFIAVAALAVAAFGTANSDGRRIRGRLGKIRARAIAKGGDAEVAQLRRSFQDSAIPSLDKLIKKMVPTTAQLRRRLARTGKRISLGEYLLTNLLVGAAVATAVWLFASAPPAVALLVGIAVGVGLPYLAIGRMAATRMTRFLKLFPDAIDLIVRGLKSGLPATESITLVGQEILDPVGSEFRHVTDSMKLGQPLETALAEAAGRIPLTDFQFFVISLSVQKETGGNLTETLENLSNLLRRRQQMKMKIRAMSSEARASAYIIGALPFILGTIIYVLNPEYASQLFTDPRGRLMVAVGLAWLSIGAGVMAKMVRFEI
ncbi:MAG TPA: type II secretion system F family protein [Alphaproteobacteria bacterium]|jgi:tight adherence protein B|nr:type II secretion system F family protein [Alphaproteobacteria bacterium]